MQKCGVFRCLDARPHCRSVRGTRCCFRVCEARRFGASGGRAITLFAGCHMRHRSCGDKCVIRLAGSVSFDLFESVSTTPTGRYGAPACRNERMDLQPGCRRPAEGDPGRFVAAARETRLCPAGEGQGCGTARACVQSRIPLTYGPSGRPTESASCPPQSHPVPPAVPRPASSPAPAWTRQASPSAWPGPAQPPTTEARRTPAVARLGAATATGQPLAGSQSNPHIVMLESPRPPHLCQLLHEQVLFQQQVLLQLWHIHLHDDILGFALQRQQRRSETG